jgi:hypothetical protein
MRTLSWTVLFFWLSGTLCQGQQNLRSNGLDLNVTGVVPFDRPGGGTIYQIDLQYRTTGNRAIEIAGLGQVAGEGELTFLARDLRLRIADPATHTQITELTLRPTGIPAGSPSKDLPDASDFSFPSRQFECDCQSDADLFRKVNTVLNRYFVQGITPTTLTPPYRLISTYRMLSDVPNPYVGKVAVLIEYPVQLPPDKLGFRIAWIARESRAKSSTWPEASSRQVLDSATRFVETLINEIRQL